MIRLATIACLSLAFLAAPLFAQDPVDRLTAMENNLNGMMAKQARMQSDLTTALAKIDDLTQKVDALAVQPKASAQSAPKQVWQPATSAWGTNSVGRFVTVSSDSTVQTETVQAMPMASSGSACANGSCSTAGSSMRGIGIFRLRR